MGQSVHKLFYENRRRKIARCHFLREGGKGFIRGRMLIFHFGLGGGRLIGGGRLFARGRIFERKRNSNKRI